MKKLRVLVADDHPVVRSGLRALLEAQPDMEVVGEAYDGTTAVRMVVDLVPDVVVMDVSMPGVGGGEATERIRTACPTVRVVALTAHEDRGYQRRLLAAGAAGYVLKRSAAEELVTAVRRVAAGEQHLDPALAADLDPASNRQAPDGEELSEREAEVMRFLARGMMNKEIAARLDISVKTVETYKARAQEKIGLKSRVDLVRYAVQRGWLTEQ
jgi:DNA-binding NarL/FixJ family response regulator